MGFAFFFQDLMYQNPKDWCAITQHYIMITLLGLHMKRSDKKVRIMERSILSTRLFCFASHYLSNLDETNYDILVKFQECLESFLLSQIDLIVYLKADHETCLQRIQQRNRPEEKSIKPGYLNLIGILHDQRYHNTVVTSEDLFENEYFRKTPITIEGIKDEIEPITNVRIKVIHSQPNLIAQNEVNDELVDFLCNEFCLTKKRNIL